MGCGSFGRLLAGVVRRNPNTDLVAVCDEDETAGSAVGAEQGAAKVDIAGLRTLSPDLVMVATPNDTHLDAAAQVVEATANLFIEKPLATSINDAESLLTLASAAGSELFVGHVQRVLPGVLEVEARLRRGDIGTPRHYRARRLRRAIRNAGASWKWSHARSGGELLHEIHEIDLMTWLCGPGSRSWAFGEASDQQHLVAELEGGVIGSVTIGRDSHFPAWDIVIDGDDGSLRIDFLKAKGAVYRERTASNAWSLLGDPTADADLIAAAAGPQQYGGPNSTAPAWMMYAVDLEVSHVVAALNGGRNVLGEQPDDAIRVVCNATRYSVTPTDQQAP